MGYRDLLYNIFILLIEYHFFIMWKQYYIIGLFISIGTGWLFSRFIDLGQIVQALTSMNLWWLFPCLSFYILSCIFRTIRWHYLMRPIARVHFYPLFSALFIGYLGNNFLPAHLGEVIRSYILGRSEKINKFSVFATLIIERVCDGLTILFFLILILLYMDLPGSREYHSSSSRMTIATLQFVVWLGLGGLACLIICFQLLRWQRERLFKFLAIFLKFLPLYICNRCLELVNSFVNGLAFVRIYDLFWIIFYSLIIWFFLGLYAWSLFPAFGLRLGIMAGIFIEVVVALALLLPSAPAFLGTFQLAAAFTLTYLGADTSQSGSYAIVLWLVHFLSTTLIGIPLFFLSRVRLTDASRLDKLIS